MSFIESADDVERQLREATDKLAMFEEDISNEQAWERLQTHSPGHPVVLMRLGFVLMGMASSAVGIALLVLPLAYPSLDRATQRQIPIESIRAIEAAVGFPLPAVFLVIGVLLLFGFWMLGLAAVSIGRDSPMLDWEAKQHAEIAEEVKRLTQQKNAMARHAATPAAPRGRMTTPSPSAAMTGRSTGGGSGALVDFDSPTAGGGATGSGLASFGGVTGGGGDDALVSFDSSPSVPSRPPEEMPTAPHRPMNTQPPATGGLVATQGSNFETPRSTVIPTWGPCDPWLQDTLRRAEALSNTFPIQARLEFSPEADLPFLLALERATPAMAVRAMMAYVEFLANIPTPRKARVDLGGQVVDRSFYRNVMSAVEPYFPDTCELVKGEHDVELNFVQSDPRWGQYPYLPIQ